jgi:hypothetical protein
MSALFFESPIWLVLCGGFVVAVASYFWTQTGNRTAAYTAVAALAMTVILTIVNVQVETTREAVARLLDEVAEELAANDLDAVYSHIHPDAASLEQRARAELQNFKFYQAKVTRIKEITVSDSSVPAKVVAEFNAFVEVETQGQKVGVPRFVKVFFSEKDGQWLVTDYEHYDASQGFRKES